MLYYMLGMYTDLDVLDMYMMDMDIDMDIMMRLDMEGIEDDTYINLVP